MAVNLGKVLFVNLTSGSIQELTLDEAFYRDYMGGVGFGARILYERMPAGADALGPDNIFGVAAGVVTGAQVPAAPRYMVMAKSPLTGCWGDANAGGYFGHELRAAGIMGVFFSGVSPKPVYLWLSDGKAELRDASQLWGKETYQTVDILHNELNDPKIRIACIGPAGEQKSLLASVMNDVGDAAGRAGLGAVMGSKRLKAIAVRGAGEVYIADRERLNTLREDFTKGLDAYSALTKWGTIEEIVDDITMGITAIKNWNQQGPEAFPDYAPFNAEDLAKKYEVEKHTCWGCPIRCKGYFRIDKGPYTTSGKIPKTEYETFAAFGPMCYISDVEAIIQAGDICNRFGMDTISAGSAISFAMECYEKGIINKKDTGGIELNWGSVPAMLALLDKMVKREGFGAVLADGVRVAGEKIGRGSDKIAVHVHGQEPGFQDSRFWPGRGLIFFSDPSPGRHTAGILPCATTRRRSVAPYPELQFPKVDLLNYKTVGPMHAKGSNYYHFTNAAGFCLFACGYAPMATVDYVAAVSGWDFTAAEALKTGWRIQTLRHAFNVREGLRPSDFKLPVRMSRPAMAGQHAGKQIDFEAMRESYFDAMGWDLKSGWPRPEALKELGLDKLIVPAK